MNHGLPKTFNAWPLGLIAFLACFIVVIAGLVIFLSSQNVELVTPDYYDQEMRYQTQIDRIDRTAALAQEIRVFHDDREQQIVITLPASHARQRCEGRIHLYRPSAAGLDRRIKLELDSQGRQALDAKALQPGLWKVRIQWTVQGQEYYADRSVVVPPRPS